MLQARWRLVSRSQTLAGSASGSARLMETRAQSEMAQRNKVAAQEKLKKKRETAQKTSAKSSSQVNCKCGANNNDNSPMVQCIVTPSQAEPVRLRLTRSHLRCYNLSLKSLSLSASFVLLPQPPLTLPPLLSPPPLIQLH